MILILRIRLSIRQILLGRDVDVLQDQRVFYAAGLFVDNDFVNLGLLEHGLHQKIVDIVEITIFVFDADDFPFQVKVAGQQVLQVFAGDVLSDLDLSEIVFVFDVDDLTHVFSGTIK